MPRQKLVVRRPGREGRPVCWALMSDYHLGHIASRVDVIRRELEIAADAGAMVYINGDVFDCVPRSDRKRWDATQTLDFVRNAKDPRRKLVRFAADLLKPFAASIYLVGRGNHEESWTKATEDDLVTDTVDVLNAHLAESGNPHRIIKGGISRYVTTKIDVPSGKGKPLTLTHQIWGHHGSGGDAPQTRGTIQQSRAIQNFDADAYTHGHLHHKTSVRASRMYCSRHTGEMVKRDLLVLQTASYFENYLGQDDDDVLNYTYAESHHHAPKPMGGWMLRLTPKREGARWQLTQHHHDLDMPTAVTSAA